MFSAPRSCPRPPRPARRTGPSAPAAAATRPPSTGISHRVRSSQVSCTYTLRTFACSLKCVSMRFRARLADSLDGASMATDSCRQERKGGMSESDCNGTRRSNAKLAHTHIFASHHHTASTTRGAPNTYTYIHMQYTTAQRSYHAVLRYSVERQEIDLRLLLHLQEDLLELRLG